MKKKVTPKSKILKNAKPSMGWLNMFEYKKENRAWLCKSGNVAFAVLEALDEKKMTQTELAEKMDVSRQQVNTILKGHENLTLETLTKLEVALDIKLGAALDEEPYKPEETRKKKQTANRMSSNVARRT